MVYFTLHGFVHDNSNHFLVAKRNDDHVNPKIMQIKV
jgi:hypothetical protein